MTIIEIQWKSIQKHGIKVNPLIISSFIHYFFFFFRLRVHKIALICDLFIRGASGTKKKRRKIEKKSIKRNGKFIPQKGETHIHTYK